MPTATEVSEAPALAVLDPAASAAIANPVIDDSNIKLMAERFRKEYPARSAAPDPAQQPDPSKMAPLPKPAAIETKAATDGTKSPVGETKSPTGETKVASTETDDDDGIPAADAVVPLSRQNWQKLHASRNDVRARLEKKEKESQESLARAKQLEEELAKMKSSVPPDLEVLRAAAAEKERLAKEHTEALAQLETLNLERSPRFQNWWKTETEKHLKIAERHVPADKREEIRKLLMEPSTTERNTALSALMETLPPISQRLVSGALEQLEGVQLQREEALKRGSDHWKQLQVAEREERAKAESDLASRRAAIADKALTYARRLPSFQTDPAHPESAATAAKNEAWVRAVVSGQVDEETATMIPAAAVEYLRLTQTEIPRLQSELAKRDELIKQLQSASPAPGGGTASVRASEPTPGSAFASAVRKAMGK